MSFQLFTLFFTPFPGKKRFSVFTAMNVQQTEAGQDRTKLTLKLDFPGNLCLAVFAILAMFLFFIFCPLFAHMAYCLPHSSSTFRSWMRARIWLRAAFVPKLRLGRVAICKLEPALNVILAKSHKGVPAKPLPMCNMCYIKIYHKNNFITLYTGWFFNGYPLKMSLDWQLPKFAWTGTHLNFLSVGIKFTLPDTEAFFDHGASLGL